jgi:hypothetical protein
VIAQVTVVVEHLGFEGRVPIQQCCEGVADGRPARKVDIDPAVAGGFREVRKELPLHVLNPTAGSKNPSAVLSVRSFERFR